MQKPLSSKYTIHTVKNSIKILKIFSAEKPNLSLSEIARELNLNISTVKRLVKTLEDYDYLQRDPVTKRYYPGFMVLNLSGIITTTMEIHKEAKPILEEYVQKLDNAIHLGILEGVDIVYLDKLETKHPIRLNSHIGKKNPAYCTACGKIMLAYQKREKLDKLILKMEKNGFIQYGKNTVKNSSELLAQLEDIRRQGFAVCIDEYYKGISIGAPVYDYTGEVIAAISVTGRMFQIKDEQIPFLTNQIITASNELSKKLGHYV